MSSGPKVQLPPADADGATADAGDPIQQAYGAGSLIAEPVAAPASPPPGVGANPSVSKWPRAKALAYLMAQPKLPVYVPLSRDEEGKEGAFYQQVIWNGWAVPVPKGRTIYVPVPIAEILNQSMARYHTQQARESRAVDMMLITPDRPGGLLMEEMSDPAAVELIRRGAPLRLDD